MLGWIFSCEEFSLFRFSSHAITSDVSIEETAKAAEMFQSDGVIVTGTATGEPSDVGEMASKLTLTVLVATIDAQWEGMGDVGSARYDHKGFKLQ